MTKAARRARDDFSKQTVTELAKSAGYRCSNPECRRPTDGSNAAQDGSITIGVGAHICAASLGGPRYNAAQTPEERRAKANGIWLCQSCGRLIDTDERKFTVELLIGWKRRAQERSFRELVAPSAGGATEEVARVASIIASDNAGSAGPDFEGAFARVKAAAESDLAAFKRMPYWSGETVELTLRILGDHNTPPFAIGQLPLAVEVAPEVAIVAAPGTGKTVTLLQLAAHALAGSFVVPLYFRLGDWSAGSLPLLASLQQRHAFDGLTRKDLLALARHGRLLLLLDGWNEIDEVARKRLRIELEQLRRDYPDIRIVITTRRQMLDVPVGGPHIAIEALSDEQEIAIAHARLGAAGERIVDEAWRTPGVRELIATPLYLSALLASGSLGAHPTTKEEILRLFVRQHEQADDHAEALQAMLFGCHVAILTALACHLNATGSTAMTDAEARRIVSSEIGQLNVHGQLTGQPQPFAVLELLSAHHTMIRSGHDNSLTFQHQQFQEWYASHKVAELIRASFSGDLAAREALRVEVLDRPAWEESIFFAVERVSREPEGRPAIAHAVRLALAIDPMLAAEMIYRAAPAVWQIVRTEVGSFVDRWHHRGEVDRAVRFMVMTGQAEFAPLIWPIATSADMQIQLSTLRAARRFRPSVLGSDLQTRVAALPETVREHLLGSIASHSGVEGMDLATELAKSDPSPAVQEDVVSSLLFRRANRHAEDLLAVAHDETLALIARRDYGDDIRDPTVVARLDVEQAKVLAGATGPVERIHLLLRQPPDHPGRDTEITAAIADTAFQALDQHAGTAIHLAYQQAPEAVLEGLRQRLEAGLELPSHAYDLLGQLPVTDEGPIASTILNLGHDERRSDAVATMAGPKTVTTLVERFLACARALRSARQDRNLSEEFHRLRSRIGATRAPFMITAILAHAETDAPDIIAALASLIALHGGHNEQRAPIAVDLELRPQMVGLLHGWVDRIVESTDSERHHLSDMAGAIGRVGLRELIPDLKRLLDEDLLRLQKARDGFLDAQRRHDIRATSDARTLYTIQYRDAFTRIGGDEVAAVVIDYLDDRVFGFEAAVILKAISDGRAILPEPDKTEQKQFRQWPWFDEVATARAARATHSQREPESKFVQPVFAAVDRLTKPDTDRDGQLLAIRLTRIALSMPHEDRDVLVARVMALPQPITAKRELLAAMVLDGQMIDVRIVMQAIDEWLAEDPKNAWHKRQNTWEIEPWLELLPFSTHPRAIIEGLTKVKSFYGAGWAKTWGRVLEAVALLPGEEGDVLLAELTRTHLDIARDYDWIKAIQRRGSAAACLLYIDLFAEGLLGHSRHGVDAWQAGRELAPHVAKFPQLKAELRRRYESSAGPGRALIEHMFEEWGDEVDLIAIVKKYAATGQSYDGHMNRIVRGVALRQEPASDGSGAYYLYPASVSRLRSTLFGLLSSNPQESALAKTCLTAIDVLHDEHGIAENDTRHPDVRSAIPWPLEVAASGLDPSLTPRPS